MKQNGLKYIAFLLGALLILGALPIASFAEQGEATDVIVPSDETTEPAENGGDWGSAVGGGTEPAQGGADDASPSDETTEPAGDAAENEVDWESTVGGETVAAAPQLFSAEGGETPASNPDGLHTDKYVTKNEDDGYTITMEAFVTGNVTTTTVTTPLDIVLVLDQSGSMLEAIDFTNMTKIYSNSLDQSLPYYVKVDGSYIEVQYFEGYGWYSYNTKEYYNPKRKSYSNGNQFYDCDRKLAALKTAANSFIASVQDNAATNGVDHRIAVVGFASGYVYNYEDDRGYSHSDYYYYKNTELFDGSIQYIYNAGETNSPTATDAAQQHYADAFKIANVSGSVNSDLTASITALDAEGGTLINYGMEMAKGVFDAVDYTTEANKNRKKIVVVLTDGEPGWNGYDETIASSAIGYATTLKGKSYNSTVYTIGVGVTRTQSVNFMKAMATDDKHYYSVSDSTSLSTIFDDISDEITSGNSSVEMGSSTVVTDPISQYFTLPSDATADSINVYTAAYKGNSEDWTATANWADKTAYNGATVGLDGNTVTVTNFDYAENFVSKDAHEGDATNFGKKLIIEIPVVVREGFWGGNNVPTNGNATIACGDITGSFPQPTVNVPLNIPAFAGKDVNIYAGNTAPEIADLYTAIEIPTGDYAWKVAYVNTGAIAYTYSENAQSISNLADTTGIDITVTVKPSEAAGDASVGAANDINGVTKEADPNATVNVYTPTVTFPDSTIYYGDAPIYAEQNRATVAWKHDGAELPAGQTMTGTAPTLSYTYSPIAGTLTADSNVDVTKVENGSTETDITAKTTFGSRTTDTDPHDFTVYVATPNFAATDTTIYITNSTDLDARVTLKDWTVPTGAPETIQGTAPTLNAATFTYVDANGGALNVAAGNTVSPETCTAYTVTSVKLSNEAVYDLPAGEGITPVTATVHVLVPKIVCTDTTIYLGESTNLSKRWTKNAEIQWVDTNDDTGYPTAEETAPVLTITAAILNDSALKNYENRNNDTVQPKKSGEYDYDLTVKVGDKTFDDTVASKWITKAGATTDNHDFTVKVVPCTLTVAKSGGDIRDSYIFTVSYTDPWTNGSVELKVAVRGGGEAKIVDLPIGKYTVTEDEGWSWRYDVNEGNSVTSVTLGNTSQTCTATATVTNEKTNGQWLSAESYAVNKFLATFESVIHGYASNGQEFTNTTGK